MIAKARGTDVEYQVLGKILLTARRSDRVPGEGAPERCVGAGRRVCGPSADAFTGAISPRCLMLEQLLRFILLTLLSASCTWNPVCLLRKPLGSLAHGHSSEPGSVLGLLNWALELRKLYMQSLWTVQIPANCLVKKRKRGLLWAAAVFSRVQWT